jgi:hypothetical protein
MSPRTIRVTVRGSFADLTSDQRAQLVAEAADHDFLQASYTPEGHLSYDIAARPFFTFRFLTSADSEADIPAAAARAEATALAWLRGRGLGYKGVTVRADDLSLAPQGARQRREAARKVS